MQACARRAGGRAEQMLHCHLAVCWPVLNAACLPPAQLLGGRRQRHHFPLARREAAPLPALLPGTPPGRQARVLSAKARVVVCFSRGVAILYALQISITTQRMQKIDCTWVGVWVQCTHSRVCLSTAACRRSAGRHTAPTAPTSVHPSMWTSCRMPDVRMAGRCMPAPRRCLSGTCGRRRGAAGRGRRVAKGGQR